MIEHAGCSWRSEDGKTFASRERFAESAAFHDAHGDDLSQCDSWVCICGKTDSRGGTWENVEDPDSVVHMTCGASIHVKCTECGRIYDLDGSVVSSPGLS